VREVNGVPVGRIIRLISKALRFSKGGFNVTEVHILVADLLSLAADLTDLCREPDVNDV
jgi:hypothetical protein